MSDPEGPTQGESTTPAGTNDPDTSGLTGKPAWLTEERRMILMFVVVTVVVGLIGFAVSARFEPLEPPSGGARPGAISVTTTTTTTTTTAPDSATTIDGDSTTSTTVSSDTTVPGSLTVSAESVDFGAEGIAGEFEIINDGGGPAGWSLESSSDAISLSSTEGETAGGESTAIDMSLNRDEIEEGELAETVTLTWDGGEIEIAVAATHEDNPIIHNPQASPSSVEVSGDEECTNTETTVSARIRDTSPLESVVVRWSPDGGGEQETEMTAVGNDMFEAVIGPFTVERSATARIVAFDERGNAGGATTTINVVACP
ncbi:MAG: hypothetical protein ACLFVZ_00070 [Actinomycetota bacterium]